MISGVIKRVRKRTGRLLIRAINSSAGYPQEPLTTPIEIPRPASVRDTEPLVIPQDIKTQITRLPNGLRVASHASFGQYSTVGVFIDTGSRYEVEYTSGVSHFLHALLTSSQSSNVLLELEQYGGQLDIQRFRDIMFYNVSAFSYALPQVVSLLAELTWRPKFIDTALEECRRAIEFEWETHQINMHPEMLLMDMINQAGYRDNTVGLPYLCPQENIPKINMSEIKKFVASHFDPSRMVLVGVNVDHTHLSDLAHQHFTESITSWSDLNTDQLIPVDQSIAQYTGGKIEIVRDSAPIIGPNRPPELTHVALAMESCSYNENDFFTFAVLNMLMGGGGSFSAGGPGKGMYSQLYLNVLNQYHWVYHAQALNHPYSDTGLFCMFGSSHPTHTRNLIEVLCGQFYDMTHPCNSLSVARAKKQLQSSLLMNLESRVINFEDIGRQVLGYSMRKTATEIYDKIEAVTPEDITRVAKNMYDKSRPSLAVLGDLTNSPDLKEVEALLNKGQFSKQKKSFFSFR